jgi:hypothetical protein
MAKKRKKGVGAQKREQKATEGSRGRGIETPRMKSDA